MSKAKAQLLSILMRKNMIAMAAKFSKGNFDFLKRRTWPEWSCDGYAAAAVNKN